MAKSAEAWAEGFDCRGDVCVFEPCRCRLRATPIIAAAQAEARAEALEEARTAIRREADNHPWGDDVAETAVVLAGVAIDGLLVASKGD